MDATRVPDNHYLSCHSVWVIHISSLVSNIYFLVKFWFPDVGINVEASQTTRKFVPHTKNIKQTAAMNIL